MALYKDLFNGNINISLKTAVRVLSAYPASAGTFIRLSESMKEAQSRRARFAADGADVPPLMIVSTTDECNLACKGCYACERKRTNAGLTDERIAEILCEASELGVGIVMLAGGEPLLSHGWLDSMALHPEMLGLVFTNGTLLGEIRRAWFAGHRHVVPVLSIEGGKTLTDSRRGDGVYGKVTEAMEGLRLAGVPFGVSVTVTGNNIGRVVTDAFVAKYIDKGCRLFIFVEYVPAEAGTDSLVLREADKARLSAFAKSAGRKHSALCIAFPGDESGYGGCLAAGRGFIYVGTGGDLEPCPFAPFSDVSLRDTPLSDALKSDLLRIVRDNHDKLVEGEGGCALWRNREWIGTLAGNTASK